MSCSISKVDPHIVSEMASEENYGEEHNDPAHDPSHVPVVDVRPPKWLLPDRAGFSEWIRDTFVYDNERSSADPYGTQLFPQQRFVRDYIQTDSPYGGLVLYHGLGVGKSCAAVASIRALESNYRVVVMLPASITSNFITEMRRCGGHGYAEDQTWRFDEVTNTWVTVNEQGEEDDGGITKGTKSGTKFGRLDAASRQAVRDQLNMKIRERVHFISYNGISGKKILEMTADRNNIFDGAVVVIDEVHNFISQVIKQRNVFHLYERMMAADPRKVILLTGTPFMNSVMELPYLINLANGYERFLEIRLYPGARGRENNRRRHPDSSSSSFRVLAEEVKSILDRNRFVNRHHVGHATTKDKGAYVMAIVHLTPNGFVRAVDDTKEPYFVVPLSSSTSSSHPDRSFGAGKWMDRARRDLFSALETRLGASTDVKTEIIAKNRLLLPVGDTFSSRYTTNLGLTLKNVDILARKIQGTVSYFGAYDPAVYPKLSEKRIVECPMSARQFDEYKEVRVIERRLEEAAKKFSRATSSSGVGDSAGGDGMGAYRPRSRAMGNFVFPTDVDRPQKKEIAKTVDEETLANAYEIALGKAVSELRENKPETLMLNGRLREHSPKFHTMMLHFRDVQHLALVYSEFRTMEGVGLLSACLDVNGYSRIYVKKTPKFQDGSTSRRPSRYIYRVMETAPGATNRYIIHDNSDPEAANIALSAFNSEFDRLPQQAREDVYTLLKLNPASDVATTSSDMNKHGRLAKLLLVTKSGAEGINLKNVREVHLMEPFWNSNRIDQVVGRAVRAQSHAGLPEDERKVDQYLYMSVMTPEQAEERTIRLKDEGKTSDQHVYEITLQKDALVGQMLRVLKSSAVDCLLHENQHRSVDGTHSCLRRVANLRQGDFAYGMSYDDDIGKDGAPAASTSDEDMEYDGRTTVRLVAVRVRGLPYFMDPSTRLLYDYDLLKGAGELKQVSPTLPTESSNVIK